jgi:hypothetical protein
MYIGLFKDTDINTMEEGKMNFHIKYYFIIDQSKCAVCR